MKQQWMTTSGVDRSPLLQALMIRRAFQDHLTGPETVYKDQF